MIGLVVVQKVKQGRELDFENAARELAALVRANEPGAILYAFHRGTAPDTFVVLEQYADRAAFDVHLGSDHFRRIGAVLRECADGPPTITRFGDPL